MKKCPFCAELIQDEAIKCRYCGEFVDGRPDRPQPAPMVYGYGYAGYEYRSEVQIFGWPLIHIASGVNLSTGRLRVAKGFIAIGNVAFGAITIGGLSFGLISFGGLSLGLLALGGLAFGAVAIGGLAVGVAFAMGGVAISGLIAAGGLAIGKYTISSFGVDPELVPLLERYAPGLRDFFQRTPQ